MRCWKIAKGHGTENDFVIVNDRHGMLNPSDDDVRYLCNRRTGVGGDGLLRAIRSGHIPEWDGDPEIWFMDYRNADGSISEMCGNGVRAFARFLSEEGLTTETTIPIATRAGLKLATHESDGSISVDMGRVTVDTQRTTVRLGETEWDAYPADVGNPHAVCFVDEVDSLDLRQAPQFSADRFPEGVNVEFVQFVAPGHVRMRVFERGVGETRSCGTGTVAVAAASRRYFGPEGPGAAHGGQSGSDDNWRVDVPGGTLRIALGESSGESVLSAEARMTGPAVVQLHGEVLLPD